MGSRLRVPPPDKTASPERIPDGPSPNASDLVRQFSHDVASPLMSVLALTEVLLMESRHDPRLREDLQRIHAAAEEAIALVRSLNTRVSVGSTPPAGSGL